MPLQEWTEIAPGVHQRRYDPLDVSVVAIVGDGCLGLVDTRNNPAEAAEVVSDVKRRFGLPIALVVNTHAHYDHTFGNQVFGSSGLDVPIHGHAGIPRHFAEFEAPRLAAVQADRSREPDKEWADVILTPPTHFIAEPTTLAVGGRMIELLPLAPGHTDTDLAVFVPDARVWILGDVIEQSAPPMFGSGSFPLGWPGVLSDLLVRIEPGDAVVPGHGSVVRRDFVEQQQRDLAAVAEAIRTAHAGRLDPRAAASAHAPQSPWPAAMLEPAFLRGFAHLAAR